MVPEVVMSLILLIYQVDDQLLPDTDRVLLATPAAAHFGADKLRPLVGRPLATFTLEHDLLGRPPVVPTIHILEGLAVVCLRTFVPAKIGP